jgi:hypothetical protein
LLGILDSVIIVLSLALVVGAVLRAAGKKQTDAEYFLARRALGWPFIGMSLLASNRRFQDRSRQYDRTRQTSILRSFLGITCEIRCEQILAHAKSYKLQFDPNRLLPRFERKSFRHSCQLPGELGHLDHSRNTPVTSEAKLTNIHVAFLINELLKLAA